MPPAYEELSLEGMDFDSVDFEVAVLKANFGEGYGAGALVGSSAGLHRWKLSSGALPGDVSYGSLIDSEARFDYYWNFFKARMAEGDGVFIIDFRGKKYHASFVDTKVSFEVFTYDLFAGGVDIKQRKVSGITYNSDDGSLDLSLPDTPTGFHVVSTTSTSVTLDWDDVVGEPLTGGGVALTGGGTALTG